jgi:2-succinyl-6-hydroxy-2,4-cyclohexadiene-1-carboxylate synthase
MSQTRTVLVHGFTQSGAVWNSLRNKLTFPGEISTPDLPGHGERSDVAASLNESGDILGREYGPASFVGYSLGARVCLHTALRMPQQVERLVLCSGTPGIETQEERDERVGLDRALAMRLLDIGVPAFLDEWLALPLFAGVPHDATARKARETNTAAGLASSLRCAGTGTQTPLWDRLSTLTMPVLVVTGANDKKFTEIGERTARAIGANAAHVVVQNAGHSVPLEQPDLFAAVLNDFLR